MLEKLLEICEEFNYKIKKNKIGITLEDIILGSLNGGAIKYVMLLRNCSKATVTARIKEAFPDRNLRKDRDLVKFLLGKKNLKICPKCNTLKHFDDFYFYENGRIYSFCKECSSIIRTSSYNKNPGKEIINNNSRRNRIKKMQTPIWAELEEINCFYRERPLNMHVDHIVPLNGKNVCGLHVLSNLQYLTPEENLSKNNKFDDIV